MNKIRWSMLVLLFAGLLTLAACSDDDEDTDGGAETDAAAASTDGTADDADDADDADNADETADDAAGTDDDAVADDAAAPQTISVVTKEWAVEAPAEAAAGTVAFDVHNEGSVDHQLTLVRTDLAADALPTESAVVPESAAEVVGMIEDLGVGAEATASFELEAGNYVLFCNVPGHYDLGMRTGITVQ